MNCYHFSERRRCLQLLKEMRRSEAAKDREASAANPNQAGTVLPACDFFRHQQNVSATQSLLPLQHHNIQSHTRRMANPALQMHMQMNMLDHNRNGDLITGLREVRKSMRFMNKTR